MNKQAHVEKAIETVSKRRREVRTSNLKKLSALIELELKRRESKRES